VIAPRMSSTKPVTRTEESRDAADRSDAGGFIPAITSRAPGSRARMAGQSSARKRAIALSFGYQFMRPANTNETSAGSAVRAAKWDASTPFGITVTVAAGARRCRRSPSSSDTTRCSAKREAVRRSYSARSLASRRQRWRRGDLSRSARRSIMSDSMLWWVRTAGTREPSGMRSTAMTLST